MLYCPFARSRMSIDRFVSTFLSASTDFLSTLARVWNVFGTSLRSFWFNGAASLENPGTNQLVTLQSSMKEGDLDLVVGYCKFGIARVVSLPFPVLSD